MPYMYQKQEGRIRHLKQANLNDWTRPKNSKSKRQRFSADYTPRVQLGNRFSVLETDTLEVVQHSPSLLTQKGREVGSFAGS
jgi:hypothetical protein